MMSDDFDNDSGFAHALDPQDRCCRYPKYHTVFCTERVMAMISNICMLSDNDIRKIVTDMFRPERITNIRRHKREGYVSCTMYSKWTSYDENGKEDTVTCKDDVEIHDPFEYCARPITCSDGFPVTAEDIVKLKQFCFSKGLMPEWMQNNPYVK